MRFGRIWPYDVVVELCIIGSPLCARRGQFDHPVEMADPTVAAGIIGQLGLHQAGGARRRGSRCRPDRRRPLRASLDDSVEGFLCEAYDSCVGVNPGTWRSNSSSQPPGVLEREVDECVELLQRLARSAVRSSRRDDRGAAGCPQRTSRLQRVLRIEVLVERRLTHAYLARQPPKRDTGDAVRSSELPSGADDLRGSGEATFRDGRCRHQRSLHLPIIDRTITYR